MLRASLFVVVGILAIFLAGVPSGAQDKKDDKKDEKKKDDKKTIKASVVKHDKEKDTLTAKYKEKDNDKEYKELVINLKEEMKLLNEDGKDVKIDDFLKNLEVGEAITIIMDAKGNVTEIRDIKDKKKDEKKKEDKK